MPRTICAAVVTAQHYSRSVAVTASGAILQAAQYCKRRNTASGALLLLLALAAQASNDPEIEGAFVTSDRIASGPSVGADIFDIPIPGERFKPLTGEVGHVAADLSVTGDGLLRFDLVRRHQLHPAAYPYALGTMSIDVPSLSYRTQHAPGRPRGATDNTCLNLTVADADGNRVLSSTELFDDLRFNYGDISVSLLPRRHVAADVLSNYPDASEAVAISKEHWLFRCDGDTFVVQSPDATEYRFNGRLNSEVVKTSLDSAEVLLENSPQGHEIRDYYFNHYRVKASSIQRLNASVDLAYESAPEVQVGATLRDTKARWPYHSSFERHDSDLIDHVLLNPRRLSQVTLSATPDTGNGARTTRRLELNYRASAGGTVCPGLLETAVLRSDNRSSDPDRVLQTVRYRYERMRTRAGQIEERHIGGPRSGCALSEVLRDREDGSGDPVPQWSFDYGVSAGNAPSAEHDYAPYVLASSGHVEGSDLAKDWGYLHDEVFELPLKTVTLPTGAQVAYQYERLRRCWYQVSHAVYWSDNSARSCREADQSAGTAALQTRTVSGQGIPTSVTELSRNRQSQLQFATTISSSVRKHILEYGRVFPNVPTNDSALSGRGDTGQLILKGGRLLTHQLLDAPSNTLMSTSTWRYAENAVFVRNHPTLNYIRPPDRTDGGNRRIETGWPWMNRRLDYLARERWINPVYTRVDTGGYQFATELTTFDTYNHPTTIKESMQRADGAERVERFTVRTYDNSWGSKSGWAVGLPSSAQLTMTGEPSSGSSTQYNAQALVQESTTDGVRTVYRYWNNGNLKSVQRGAEGTTTYSDYRLGTPRRIQSAESGLQTATVDDRGNTTSVRTALDSSREIRTDTRFGGPFSERVLKRWTGASDLTVTQPLWRATNGTTSRSARRMTESVAGAYTTTNTFDTLGRLESKKTVIPGEPNRVIAWQYDEAGRVEFASDPASTQDVSTGHAYQYDALDRLVRVVHKHGGTETAPAETYCYGSACSSQGPYAAATNVDFGVVHRDALGNVSTRNYRALGHPAKAELIEIREQINPPGTYSDSSPRRVTWIERNHTGFITKVTQGSDASGGRQVVRTYEPRTVGGLLTTQLQSEAHPEFGKTTYANFDASGRPHQIRNDAGSAITLSYDSAGRLLNTYSPAATSEIDSAGTIGRTYFRNGALKTLTGSGSTWSFDYNLRGQLASESLAVGGYNFDIGYAYNGFQHVSATTYPSGRVVRYTRNGLGEAISVTDDDGVPYVSSIDRNARGQITQANLASGEHFTQSFDSRSRPKTLSVNRMNSATGSTPMDLTYSYTTRDNVSSITGYFREADGTRGDLTNLQYDSLGRLHRADGYWGEGAGSIATYTYDVVGNVQRRHVGGQNSELIYAGGSNRVTSISTGTGSRSISHDVNGNLTSDELRSFRFDHLNRLVEAVDVQGDVQLNRYDGRNHRISLTVQTPQRLERIWYVYDSEGKRVHEFDEISGDQRDMIYLDGRAIATHTRHTGHDSDADGMPDYFERQFGLDRFAAYDAELDGDSDGLSNVEEYLNGSLPTATDSDGDGQPDGTQYAAVSDGAGSGASGSGNGSDGSTPTSDPDNGSSSSPPNTPSRNWQPAILRALMF